MSKNVIQTERLILRPWHKEDLTPFAKLNADPRVMEFFPKTRTLEETTQEFEQIVAGFEKYGWGFWATTLKDNNQFIGFIGLKHIPFEAHFTPAIEIGWRLDYNFWGKGYATEGAKAALEYGFDSLNLNEIVSITTVKNIRSQQVMKKIGMTSSTEDDFDHPKVPEGHPLRRHVLYRIKK